MIARPSPLTGIRYKKKSTNHIDWGFNNKISYMPQGKILRLTLLAPAVVHWTFDAWVTSHDTNTRDTRLGAYIADLPTKEVLAGNRVSFTFYWPEANRWEGSNFEVAVEPAGSRTKEVLAVDLMPVHLGKVLINRPPAANPNK